MSVCLVVVQVISIGRLLLVSTYDGRRLGTRCGAVDAIVHPAAARLEIKGGKTRDKGESSATFVTWESARASRMIAATCRLRAHGVAAAPALAASSSSQLSTSPWRVLLSSGLAPQTAQELTVLVETTLPEGTHVVRKLEVFIVRGEDARLAAYENYCPHAGGPLNWLPNKFLSRSKRHLLCTRHGAHFAIDDGVCVRGPCAGSRLNPLPITVDTESGDVRASEQSLLELCANGGGAYIEEVVPCDRGMDRLDRVAEVRNSSKS